MSYFVFVVAASLTVSSADAGPCTLPPGLKTPGRVITNADLDAVRQCRAASDATAEEDPTPSRSERRRASKSESNASRNDAAQHDDQESHWRARWLAMDQRVRKLRRQADELRAQAGETPRDSKKRPTGRQSPLTLTRKADALEDEAREIEERFHDEAHRAGARPGWLRPR